MIETKDIYWLAGLLEGEGAFCVRGKLSNDGSKGAYPVIQVGSTDRDVIMRAAKLMGYAKPPAVEPLGTSADSPELRKS